MKHLTNEALLKELEERGYIHIFWHVDDITSRAEEKGVELTEQETREIAENISSGHDANIGINWDSIDCFIDNFVEERNRKAVAP